MFSVYKSTFQPNSLKTIVYFQKHCLLCCERNVPKMFKRIRFFNDPLLGNKVAANTHIHTRTQHWQCLLRFRTSFPNGLLIISDSYHIVMLFHRNENAISAIFAKTTKANSCHFFVRWNSTTKWEENRENGKNGGGGEGRLYAK